MHIWLGVMEILRLLLCLMNANDQHSKASDPLGVTQCNPFRDTWLSAMLPAAGGCVTALSSLKASIYMCRNLPSKWKNNVSALDVSFRTDSDLSLAGPYRQQQETGFRVGEYQCVVLAESVRGLLVSRPT